MTQDPNRKAWNEDLKALHEIIDRPDRHDQAIALFLQLHAQVYSAELTQWAGWSFEDEVLNGLDEAAFRRIPAGGEHSLAWIIWHLARCEDITMNLLVAGGEQVLAQGNWLEKTTSPIRDTANALSPEEIAAFSAAVNIPALRGYRNAVGLRTREIVQQLPPGCLKQKPLEERVLRIAAEGAVVPAASGMIDYWASRTFAGLLMMPATRHHFLHWNEALRTKSKIQ